MSANHPDTLKVQQALEENASKKKKKPENYTHIHMQMHKII